MVLKVVAFHSKKTPKIATDLVQFLYPDEKQRIQLSFLCSAQLLTQPNDQEDGVIRINKSKRVPIKKDGRFYYGAWPQKRVSPIQSKRLFQMLKGQQIRQAGHYYDLAGLACQEYELKEKRYVLIPDKTAWFEVCPIEWVYDFKTQTVHSVSAIWSCNETSPKQLGAFGWQALQTNKMMLQLQNNSSKGFQTLRDAEADMIHAIRFFRDKEKELGISAGKGQKIFDMIHRAFYQRLSGKNKQRS